MLIESLRIVLKLVVVSVDKDKQLVVAVEAIHEDPQITQLLLKVVDSNHFKAKVFKLEEAEKGSETKLRIATILNSHSDYSTKFPF